MLFQKKFSSDLFSNPDSEYRGAPLWAWNTKLDKEELLRQIEIFKLMGMGGFHIHSRSGLETEYLSDEFMDLVSACNEKARQENMLCWLYDEDRWPSGSAGGLVTKDHSFRARYLLFTSTCNEEWKNEPKSCQGSHAKPERTNRGTLLGRYEVLLENGYLKSYHLLKNSESVQSGGNEWFAYLEVMDDSPWFNMQAYVNTLDKNAVERFIGITHERYKRVVGKDFGGTIPAIFTDEPQFAHKTSLKFADEKTDLFIPYSDDFENDFFNIYGESFLAKLPEIFWNSKAHKNFLHRYRFHDYVAERFALAFADTIGSWCKNNNIMLTGHMMSEPTLESQSRALGDCMRSYRSFQLPGIDILRDKREYSTAKQAQSAAHQFGCPGVLSELYGVTNWDFDFRGHKLQGDWQAALGINVRAHHLSWVSMKGDSKRDYPASIGYQSPWYSEYSLVEDHFARIHTAMSQGKTRVNIGVIHPIESYWLYMGPNDQAGLIKGEMEESFQNTIDWLLHEHLDFDFISESLLPEQIRINDTEMPFVGLMQYKVFLVPNCYTLRSTTLDFLKKCTAVGCAVVFSGNIPRLLDAVEDPRVIDFSKTCSTITHTRLSVKNALDPYRIISIKGEDGLESDRHIYQFREDGETAYLFIAASRNVENPHISIPGGIRITLSGEWIPEFLNSLTGGIDPCVFEYCGGNTVMDYLFFEHDSFLFRLIRKNGTPKKTDNNPAACRSLDSMLIEYEKQKSREISVSSRVPVTLSEPNVLLLDRAEYSLNGETWKPAEELLRINNEIRRNLNWPDNLNLSCQPWAIPAYEGPIYNLALRYTVVSEIRLVKLELALEEVENTRIIWNGVCIEKEISGWYTDKSIQKVPLPGVEPGINILELQFPIDPSSTIEWSYLLGDFGVSQIGVYTKIVSLPKKLVFGDWTIQGLPFYGGNVDYHFSVSLPIGEYYLEIPQFCNPLLALRVDGGEAVKIAFSPYQANFKIYNPGIHTLEIRAFGNRFNTFGAIHNCNPFEKSYGPKGWVTEGRYWSYEYQLKKMGVLITPRLFQLET